MPSPNTPQDILDRLRDVERQVRELSGRMNIRPALNTIVGGSVTIKGGGSLVVQDTDGDNVLWAGRTTPDVDGQPQQAVTVRRMDGSLAFSVWTPNTTGPQAVQISDKGSHQIFADDTVAGGLAIPYLGCPNPVPFAQSTWGTTTSATWASIARSVGFIHHPKVYINAVIATTSGVASGQIRITFNGTVVVTSGLDSNLDGVWDVPGWSWTGLPQQVTIELQAQRNSGTGTIGGSVRSIYGRQS